MKIKVFEQTPGCMPKTPENGDMFDLVTAEDYTFKCPHAKMLHKTKKSEESTERFRDVIFSYTLINLGVVIQLPEGFEAVLQPRSSTFKKWGLLQTNSVGEIDNSYSGPNDIWKMPVLATRAITIPKGTPIAQFKIQPSQKATVWQKLKWLFSSATELEKIEKVENSEDRGGFGEGTAEFYNSEKPNNTDKTA